jgi:hypothetical protein
MREALRSSKLLSDTVRLAKAHAKANDSTQDGARLRAE